MFNESGYKYSDVSVKFLQTGSEAKARADLSIKNKRIVEEQKDQRALCYSIKDKRGLKEVENRPRRL